MKIHVYSYRFAQEVLQHKNYEAAWREMTEIFEQAPLFVWPGKSKAVKRLEVVQQVMNTYFDRRLSVDNGWEYHPLATSIAGSKLKADFRKKFGDLSIQIEIQFGNMARWYSDIFKFQAGYSAKAINVGVSVVPMGAVARTIDQNVVNFERAKRELPSAELSVTLPIVMLGLGKDEHTKVVDLRATRFTSVKDLVSKGQESNRWRVVHGHLSGTDMGTIGPDSPTGPMVVAPADDDDEDDEMVVTAEGV